MSLAIDYSDGKFELGKNTLILGFQNKGKTNLVLTNIFLRFQSKINYLFVVSKDTKYKEITSHLFYEENLPKIFQEIQTLNRMENKLLIIDEITNPKNPIIECILINSHYFNITVILVSQMGDFNIVSRDYIDCVAIGGEKSVTLVGNIFEKYGTCYGDFTHFVDVINGLGRDEFLFVPKGKMNVGIIRVNDHHLKYLYSYKMFIRHDILFNVHSDKIKHHDDLARKVQNMMNELITIKEKLENL